MESSALRNSLRSTLDGRILIISTPKCRVTANSVPVNGSSVMLPWHKEGGFEAAVGRTPDQIS